MLPPRKRKMLLSVAATVAVLAIVGFGPVLNVDYQSVQIGDRPAVLVTAWRLGRARSRALVVVSTKRSHAHRVSNLGWMFNAKGIHMNGRRVKVWRKNFVVLFHEGDDGKVVLDDVACDEQRLKWLISDDPISDAVEIRRLDVDCEKLESRPRADLKAKGEVGRD